MPSDAILERLYKSKLQNYAQHQTVMALYDNNGTPNYQQLKNCNETSYWSDDEKSKTLESETMTRINHQKSKKKQKPT